jgi:dTDP-4-amino-4,6-dideoxygalactose transaminase
MINTNHIDYPEKERFLALVEALYASQRVKENGWLTKDLEVAISNRTGVKHVFFCANGTIALYLSLKALECETPGEVILSAYTPPATLDAIILAGFTPVICDVDPVHFGLCPDHASRLINNQTKAILPTHIYGNVAWHDELKQLCDLNGLTLVYDASHGFGVSYRQKDVVVLGDISAMSLQAFKTFTSLEGGFVFTDDDKLAEAVYRYRFFGKSIDDDILSEGINGKGSDLHAAFALAHLPDIEANASSRSSNFHRYQQLLGKSKSINLFKYSEGVSPNYSYMPVFFGTEETTVRVRTKLEQQGIIARRYFYPALSALNINGIKIRGRCLVAEEASRKVLCLPIYPQLTEAEISLISQIVIDECG